MFKIAQGPNFKMPQGPTIENSPPQSPQAYHHRLLFSSRYNNIVQSSISRVISSGELYCCWLLSCQSNAPNYHLFRACIVFQSDTDNCNNMFIPAAGFQGSSISLTISIYSILLKCNYWLMYRVSITAKLKDRLLVACRFVHHSSALISLSMLDFLYKQLVFCPFVEELITKYQLVTSL